VIALLSGEDSGQPGEAQSDPDTLLELVGPGSETWIVAYSGSPSEISIESVMQQRRAMVFGSARVEVYEEKREFLAGSDFVPVSTARYGVNFGVAGRGFYYTLTAELEDAVIEVVGFTAEPMAHSGSLTRLVSSFRPVDPAEEDS